MARTLEEMDGAPAWREDLVDAVVALGVARMGDSQVEARVLCARLDRQPSCLAVDLLADGKVAAYTILYTLTEAGLLRVRSGVIERGAGIAQEDLATANEGRAVYIGAVVAAHRFEIRALALLQRHLTHLLVRHPALECLLARSATGAGQRLLQRFNFEPIGARSEISWSPIDDRIRSALAIEERADRRSLAQSRPPSEGRHLIR